MPPSLSNANQGNLHPRLDGFHRHGTPAYHFGKRRTSHRHGPDARAITMTRHDTPGRDRDTRLVRHGTEPLNERGRSGNLLGGNDMAHINGEREVPGGEMRRHLGRTSAENEALSVTPSGE